MLKKYKKARGLPLSGVISYYPVTVIRIALAQEETDNQQDGIESSQSILLPVWNRFYHRSLSNGRLFNKWYLNNPHMC